MEKITAQVIISDNYENNHIFHIVKYSDDQDIFIIKKIQKTNLGTNQIDIAQSESLDQAFVEITNYMFLKEIDI